MELYRTQNSFILTKPLKKQCRMVSGSGSALELGEPGERNERQLFFGNKSRELVYKHWYIWENILTKSVRMDGNLHISSWCEKTWGSQIKKGLCWHKTWRVFIQKSTFLQLASAVAFELLQALLFLIFCTMLTVGYSRWSRTFSRCISLKNPLHFLKEMCFSRLFTAYFLCQLLTVFPSTLSLSFSLGLFLCPDLKKKKKNYWSLGNTMMSQLLSIVIIQMQ